MISEELHCFVKYTRHIVNIVDFSNPLKGEEELQLLSAYATVVLIIDMDMDL